MGFRINSTGRKRILQEHIRIRLSEPGGQQAPSFTADINLPAELGLDPTAKIYVEPYVKTSSMRFAFGTVGVPEHPGSCVLSDIDAGAAVLFRVKVVDETGEIGRILASANGIRPENDADGSDRRPLLPVRSTDLGEEIWRLDIDELGGPRLLVNNRVPDLMDELKQNAVLQGVIYPAVVRQLVHEIFDPNASSADEEDIENWVSDWKKWFETQIGQPITDIDVDNADAIDDLAARVTESFANRNRFASQLITIRGSRSNI